MKEEFGLKKNKMGFQGKERKIEVKENMVARGWGKVMIGLVAMAASVCAVVFGIVPFVSGFFGDEESEEVQVVFSPTEWFEVESGVILGFSAEFELAEGEFFSKTEIVIPHLINGEEVVEIGEHAFQYCRELTSVWMPSTIVTMGKGVFDSCTALESVHLSKSLTVIPESTFIYCTLLEEVELFEGIEKIGASAFGHCDSIASIFLPQSLKEIGAEAFSSCDSLESVEIAQNVKKIENTTFGGCSLLSSINVVASNETFSSIEGVLFNKDGSELKTFPLGKSKTTYVVPDGVETIGEQAFQSCLLEEVIFANSVVFVQDSAFKNSSKLKSVQFGSELEWIGAYAFNFCTSLQQVLLTEKMNTIGSQAFGWCFSLNTVVICSSRIAASFWNSQSHGGVAAFANEIYVEEELELNPSFANLLIEEVSLMEGFKKFVK